MAVGEVLKVVLFALMNVFSVVLIVTVRRHVVCACGRVLLLPLLLPANCRAFLVAGPLVAALRYILQPLPCQPPTRSCFTRIIIRSQPMRRAVHSTLR